MSQPRILAIESSCDETGVAVVVGGRRIEANEVATQVALHAATGGIVPELAARQQLRWIVPTLEAALDRADIAWDGIDAVAVTYGPGLIGSLLVGVNVAKALAVAHDLPLVAVNHIEGHIYANWLETYPGEEAPVFPALALVVSGGHTDLILMEAHGRYRRLGRTRDDAAGEAFDKVARLLDLGYPGGPVIERVAAGVTPSLTLPRAWLPGTNDFSFSGLKTAVLHITREEQPPPAPEIAAAFQASVVDVLAAKTAAASVVVHTEMFAFIGCLLRGSCGWPLGASLPAPCISAVVRVKGGDDFVRLFVDERERHLLHVGACVGTRARLRIRDHAPVARRKRESHVHRNLIDVDDRVGHRLRADEPAQDEARAEPARSGQRCIGVVAEVRVDLGLRDLAPDLVGRVGAQAERLQPLVDRLIVRAVVLLARLDEAVALPLADDDHDLLVLEITAALDGEVAGDAGVARLALLLLAVVRLREAEALRERTVRKRKRQRDDDERQRHVHADAQSRREGRTPKSPARRLLQRGRQI